MGSSGRLLTAARHQQKSDTLDPTAFAACVSFMYERFAFHDHSSPEWETVDDDDDGVCGF